MTMPNLDPIPEVSGDLVVAARRYLASFDKVKAVLGPGSITSTYSTWIFRWRPYVDVYGTGEVALVVSLGPGWSSPNSYNTMRFPVLQLEFLADCDRDQNGEPSNTTSAEDKAYAAFLAVDPYLHLVDAGATYFDTVRVVTSQRLADPFPIPVPDKDGVCNLIVRYALTL